MLYVMQRFSSLDNYISMHRKTTGLSQDELAVILGLSGGRGALSKYELALRLPDLRTVIAMATVFDEPIQSIFAGITQKVELEVSSRARALLERTTDKPGPATADKFSTLARLAHLDEEGSVT